MPSPKNRLRAIPQVNKRDAPGLQQFTLQVRGDDFVTEVIQQASLRIGSGSADFRTVLPNPEDVFLNLTGHTIHD